MTRDEFKNLSQRAAHHLPEEGGFDYAPESVTLTGHHYLAMTRLIREMKLVIDGQLKEPANEAATASLIREMKLAEKIASKLTAPSDWPPELKAEWPNFSPVQKWFLNKYEATAKSLGRRDPPLRELLSDAWEAISKEQTGDAS